MHIRTTSGRVCNKRNTLITAHTNKTVARPSVLKAGMRSDPASSMNNHRGEFWSPHISIPMKGDITNIDPLMSLLNGGALGSEKESRETGGNSLAGTLNSKKMEQFHTGSEKGGVQGYQSSILSMPQTMMQPKDTSNVMTSLDMPQARQTDVIFREPNAHESSTSWSNIVSSNAITTPISSPTRSITTTRSSSGETLLTSNITSQTQAPVSNNNFAYLGSARARSHSFGSESAQSHSSLLSPPHNLFKSYSFGSPADSNQQSFALGIPPSHPGHSSYKDSTLPTINQGGALQASPMMYPSTPYHDFKRLAMGSYSPISLGEDSMATDQTSPMSSPSLSPHVSPAMSSRKYAGDGSPPMWNLSDSSDFRPEPSSPHHRPYSHLPQSIPEHHRHEPHQGLHPSPYMTSQHGSMRSGVGPTSPPRLMHSSSAHHHHHSSMYPRRPGSKPHSGQHSSSQSSMHHHRSSTEVLKTLLRKKACLYEPETSFAVSLVTWLVGRSLALSQGYFTRQQLQAGVHSCVAKKIDEGHVTRTKVNRCMQVILNSCFHYIIPRPDGSEECGQAFKKVFLREAADEEGLLATLPAPWNDLTLGALNIEEGSHAGLFQDIADDGEHQPSSGSKPQGKEASSTASQAGDSSLDSGQKRSVLLCFNENIRCAADVFRCHNEFIRDVAHTGNLILTPDDWQIFFSGNKAYRKRGTNTTESRGFHLAEMHDRTDPQGLSKLRTTWCAKRYDHDHCFCAFAHVDINRGWLRRDPYTYSYKPTMCPYIKPLQGAEDCYVNMCPLGVNCSHAHSKEEIMYHPENYKRQPCRNAHHGSCPLGDICPNTHAEMSPNQGHGYNRQGGKRHYHDHHSSYHRATYPGSSKRRGSSSTGHGAGFGKIPPDGSPMLYIDPAPLSEFEKTLLLPGLQAIFRDHSSSIFYSTMIGSSSPYEYGPFGYRISQRKGGTLNAWTKPPIGKRVARY